MAETQREIELKSVQSYLKTRFIGIDSAIDSLIEKIRIWYCFPDYLFRPIIISIYGLTGTGKTELIHQLVKALNMSSAFCNVDISNPSSISYSLQSTLSNAGIKYNTQGILLIDEIQKLPLVFQNGIVADKNQHHHLNGIWSLLSNGRLFSVNEKIDILQNYITIARDSLKRRNTMLEDLYRKLAEENSRQPAPQQPDQPLINQMPGHPVIPIQNSTSFSVQQQIDALLNTSTLSGLAVSEFIDPEDINGLWESKFRNQPYDQVMKTYQEVQSSIGYQNQMRTFACSLNDATIIEFLEYKYQKMFGNIHSMTDDDFVYKRLLIIVNGNLDKLFIPPNTAEKDITCDILVNHVSNITTTDIRNELFRTFTPEQVSRFGSNFITMPALTEDNFKHIVYNELLKYATISKQQHHIDILQYITVDDVFDKIKERGFFPSQGVRPIVSAVGGVMGELIPTILSSKR